MTNLQDDATPDASIVVPVNAKGDLDNAMDLLDDLRRYRGTARIETILVVNNYPPDEPPPQIGAYETAGARVIAIPKVRAEPGVAIAFGVRLPGFRAAESPWVIAFDADCRLPDPTAIIDWYVARGREGYAVAYTHVVHYDLDGALSVRVKVALHHASRWVKRVIMRIPTTRGSSYGIRREVMLSLFEDGYLADDLNVGPAAKAHGGRIAYSGHLSHRVLTSGRMYRPGWRRIIPNLWYRLKYNLRTLPVRADAASRTGREKQDPARYDYTRRGQDT